MKAVNLIVSGPEEGYAGLSYREIVEALGSLGANIINVGARPEGLYAWDELAERRRAAIRELIHTRRVDLAVIELSSMLDGLSDLSDAAAAGVQTVGVYAGKSTSGLDALQQELSKQHMQVELMSYHDVESLRQALDERY